MYFRIQSFNYLHCAGSDILAVPLHFLAISKAYTNKSYCHISNNINVQMMDIYLDMPTLVCTKGVFLQN